MKELFLTHVIHSSPYISGIKAVQRVSVQWSFILNHLPPPRINWYQKAEIEYQRYGSIRAQDSNIRARAKLRIRAMEPNIGAQKLNIITKDHLIRVPL